jgi:hypothetical protein
MSSIASKLVPLRPIFRIGNRERSLEARFGKYDGLVMRGMIFTLRYYCGSDV